jgi:hypothetical protein
MANDKNIHEIDQPELIMIYIYIYILTAIIRWVNLVAS